MTQRQPSNPNAVLSEEGDIVGVDLGKTVFQLCVANSQWRVVEAKRLSRPQFEHFFVNRNIARVVMKACATAHHWARCLRGLGIQVQLMPAQYVRAYVRRNKTDAAGAAALLEAARCAEICPVRVKSVEQQALQTYRITSSARSKIDGGIVRPKADAVLRLTTNSNFVGSSTGKSAGFAPERMRAT